MSRTKWQCGAGMQTPTDYKTTFQLKCTMPLEYFCFNITLRDLPKKCGKMRTVSPAPPESSDMEELYGVILAISKKFLGIQLHIVTDSEDT